MNVKCAELESGLKLAYLIYQ